MSRELIIFPGQKLSDRERRYEIRRMISKIVCLPIVELKTFSGLKKVERLLSEKIKLADAEEAKKPRGPNKPA